MVTAIIKPFKLDEVREASRHRRAGHHRHGSEREFGRQKGHTELYRGAEYVVDFLPKVRSKPQSRASCSIASSRRSRERQHGKIGDGKIFVFELEQVSASAPARPARAL